jgi:hypothetical protein
MTRDFVRRSEPKIQPNSDVRLTAGLFLRLARGSLIPIRLPLAQCGSLRGAMKTLSTIRLSAGSTAIRAIIVNQHRSGAHRGSNQTR